MMRFGEVFPHTAPMIADLVVKNMDWHGSDEIQERLQKLLPPGLLDSEDPTQQGGPGQPQPQGPPAPPPDPTMQAKVEQGNIKVKQEEERLQGLQLDNVKKMAENEIKDLEVDLKRKELRERDFSPSDKSQSS